MASEPSRRPRGHADGALQSCRPIKAGWGSARPVCNRLGLNERTSRRLHWDSGSWRISSCTELQVGSPQFFWWDQAEERRKGPTPTPLQGFELGIGRPVSGIRAFDFTSLGEKKKGKLTITPPEGRGVWLTRTEAREAEARWGWKWGSEWDFWDENGEGGCPWAGHGVYVIFP